MTATEPSSTPTAVALARAMDVLERGDPCSVLDAEFRYVLVNQAQEELSGRRRAETLGKVLWEVWPEARDPRLKFWDVYHRVMRGRVPEQFEEYFPPRDLWVEVRVFPTAEGGIATFFRRINDRKRAEEALRDGERRLRLALDAAHMTAWEYDPATKRVTMTHNAGDVLGLRRGRLHEDSDEGYALIHPDDVERHRALVTKAIETGGSYLSVYRHSRGTDVIWLEERASAITDGAGRTVRLVGVTQNVTERQRAEDALREGEERLRLLVRHAPVPIAMFDREMRYLVASRRYLVDYRVGEQEVVGRSHYEVFPDIPPHWKEAHRRCLAGAVERCDQEPFVRADGTTQWIRWEIVPWRDATGQVGGLILFSEDITERKRIEEALRSREAQFEALIQELHSGVALIDSAGQFTLYNRRFLELFGLARDADIANVNSQDWSAWQVFDEDGRLLDVDEHPVRKAALTRRPVRGQVVAVRLPSGGDLRWMVVAAEPMLAADGSLTQIICTYHEITDRKRAEAGLREANEKLREADRRKDEFLGMLSHELRNPLAPIRNSTYVLRQARPGSEQALRAQAVIERQTEHLTRLVDDLLDVTRIGRGKIELRRSLVDLRDVVVRAAEDFRLPLDDRGVAFREALPEAPLWAYVDATRVTQVVGNLLHNAAKFTRRGDEVSLSLVAEGAGAVIRVRDTGAGIDPAILPSIFDPFFQGERTLARAEGGLGLGLALVKGVTELHGGTVEVTSEGKGRGAEFVVRLPCDVAAAQTSPRPSPRTTAPGRRVLVVDDNRDAADTLAELVRMHGHEVEVAYDGAAALEAVRDRRPDLVLCDLGLPGMDGYEVARAIRALGNRGVKLVAVSGYAQPEDVERALEAGFDAHLAKPPALDALERLIDDASADEGGARAVRRAGSALAATAR